MKKFNNLETGDYVYKNGIERVKVTCKCYNSVQLDFMDNSSDCYHIEDFERNSYSTEKLDFNEEID